MTDRPIVVTFGNNRNNYEFTVEDFGLGLDHNDVVDVISKYGKSLKRLSNNQLGMFGLGWKSPLAYTSSFTFIIRKDGIERKYIMSEGEEENIIDLIDEDSTELPNGVKIIIPVNSYDAADFYNKIKEQLCYFESIYFDIKYKEGIDNSFKITRYDDFQLSELNNDDNLHLCLDNVYYPLDFSKLGITNINTPIGLRFGLSDGIFPTPNREAIRYSTEAKAIILKKIKTVASKTVEMYNKSVGDTDDFSKIINHYSNDRRYIDIGHKKNVEITDLLSYSNVKMKQPHLNGVSLLNIEKIVEDRNEITSEYDLVYELRRGKMRERKGIEYLSFSYLNDNYNLYKFADRLGGNKKEYLKSITSNSSYFVKKKRTRKLFPDKVGSYYDVGSVCYHRLLDLANHPKSEWRQVIKEFQFIQERFEKKIKDADAIEIPKAWLDNRKAARVHITTKKNGHQKLEEEISCKRAESLERYVSGRNCKFTPFSLNLGKIQQSKMFYIYSSHDDAVKLDKLFIPIGRQKIALVTFSERELKKVNEFNIHNLISYEKFMKGETALFKRIVTSYLIYLLDRKNISVFDKKGDIASVSKDLSAKVCKLDWYKDTYFNQGSNEIYTAMLEVVDKYSLYDQSIYGVYTEVKETLDKFPFINSLYKEFSSYGESSIQRDAILVDLLKYNKYKVNLEHYKKPVVELTETIKIEENESI